MMKAFAAIAIVLLTLNPALAQEKILLEDAPEAVRAHLVEKYAKFKVVGIKQKKEPLEYSIEMERGERTVSLVLDAQGTVLNKTKGRIYSYDGTETPKDNDGPTMPSMGLQ